MLRRVFFVPAVVAISLAALPGCVDNDLEEVRGSLFGRACKEGTGEGLANIQVVARSEGFERSAPTSADGSYNIALLPRGEYTVVAQLADGTEQLVHAPDLKPVVAANEPTFVGEYGCSEPPEEPDSGSVAGQICNRHTGELVSEATVEVIAADGTVLASGVTDSEGNFRLDDVPEGDHIVSIRADGYSRAFPATIEVAQTTVLELNAGTCGVPFGTGCTILGSLCDPSQGEGSKLAGATVSVVRTDGPDGEPQSAVADITDTNGDFYISALIPGTYDVSISSTNPPVNETFFNQACNAGEETVIVGPDACADRTPIGRLQGQLCNLGQLEGYFTGTVYLLQGGVVKYEVAADAQGRFNFDVVAVGTYDLHLGQPARRIIPGVLIQPFQTTFVSEDVCPTIDDICENYTHEPEVASDGRILFVVDRSGSMLQAANNFGNISKWNALRNTLATVTNSLASTVSFGLFVYPDPGNDATRNPPANCAAGVQRQAVGATAAQFNAAIGAVEPSGGTPTSSTLSAVVPVVENLVEDERPLAIVLATDGAPNCQINPVLPVDEDGDPVVSLIACTCTSNLQEQTNQSCASFNCLDEQVSTGTGPIARLARLGVQTHVVGIPDVSGTVDVNTQRIFTESLNQMAIAGGAPLAGTTKFHDGSNTTALQSSLQAITKRILACQVSVDDDIAGFTSLEVRLGDSPLVRDTNRRNGWDQTGPRSIELFGNACDAATASTERITVRRCARPD